jgi:hypothetical protein
MPDRTKSKNVDGRVKPGPSRKHTRPSASTASVEVIALGLLQRDWDLAETWRVPTLA